MTQDQIERAERTAELLAARTPQARHERWKQEVRRIELVADARPYKKPQSLASNRVIRRKLEDDYEFTDRQLAIARRALGLSVD